MAAHPRQRMKDFLVAERLVRVDEREDVHGPLSEHGLRDLEVELHVPSDVVRGMHRSGLRYFLAETGRVLREVRELGGEGCEVCREPPAGVRSAGPNPGRCQVTLKKAPSLTRGKTD